MPKLQASALTSAEPVREAMQRCGTVFSRLVPVRNSSAEQKNGVPILQGGGVVRNQCGRHGNSAEPVRNPSLPSECHPRTMMTGLKVSILAKAYIQSTHKSQVRKPPRPLGPKGLGPWARALALGPALGRGLARGRRPHPTHPLSPWTHWRHVFFRSCNF